VERSPERVAAQGAGDVKLFVWLAAWVMVTAPVEAQAIESVRLGVMDHNIRVADGKNADKEGGVNVSAELRWRSPVEVAFLMSPHPYVLVSGNTDGRTSFVAAGLQWDWSVGAGWTIETGFGYALHDGALENPYPPASAEARAFSAGRVLLGSRDLFRSSLALTYPVTPALGVQLLYEHLSHGQILGEGRNQGLDELGVRLVLRR
jgi:hypothetical protein